MARLPKPGGDDGNWGGILNDFLKQSLKSDGTLRDGVVENSAVSDNSISEEKLSTTVQSKLNQGSSELEWDSIINKPAFIASGDDQAAARSSIGAGTSSLIIGATADTAAAGDDSRLSDQRTPLDESVTSAKLANGVVTPMKLSESIQTSLAKADSALQTVTRPLASSYRPLKGVTGVISSTISSGEVASDVFYTWDNSSSRFRYVGCQPVAFSDPTLGVNFNVGLDASNVANVIEVEFWSNATTIRVNFYNIDRTDVWAVVDDMRISDGTYQHADFDNAMCTWTLTQPAPVYRKWRLGLPALTFRGMGTNAGAAMVPTANGFQMAVIGDSYVSGGIVTPNAISEGVAGSISSGALFGEFVQETGIDVWRVAVSGTGYVAQGDYGTNGPYGAPSRMNALASLPEFDAIVVWSSANDKPHASASVVSAAQAFWTSLHDARPDTPIIVVGPECTGWPDAVLDVQNNDLRVAANAHPHVLAYVDLRDNNFMSGTGFDGSPQGDGNTDIFISADGSHLTHHGARYWGQNIARLLGTVAIPADQHGGSY